MKAKIAAAISNDAQEALSRHAMAMYSTLGKRVIIIAELASTERTQIAPDEEKDVSVTLQIKQLEVAHADLETPARDAMQALYLTRTATGTLDEDDQVKLAADTVAELGRSLAMTEAARLHAGISHWLDYVRRSRSSNLSAEAFRKELATIADGLNRVLYPIERAELDLE